MPTIDIECSECGHTIQIEDSQLGTTMKCPKCKFDFVAESGFDYELADEPAPRSSGSSAPSHGDEGGAGEPRASKKPPRDQVETDAQRKLRERMEKWAEE